MLAPLRFYLKISKFGNIITILKNRVVLGCGNISDMINDVKAHFEICAAQEHKEIIL